jgi:hypothetical protein
MLAVSRFVLRHKLAVAVFWLAVLAAGGAASAKLSGRLSAQGGCPAPLATRPAGESCGCTATAAPATPRWPS